MTGGTPGIVALVGNPKTNSRTRSLAEAVAAEVAGGIVAEAGYEPEVAVIDLGEFGGRVFDGEDDEVSRALTQVESARILVVATPTYKASYSGLLKAFLDRLGGSALAGVVAVPVMVGAGPRHHLALEVHLRPLLVEMAASCPSAGLFVLEEELDQLDPLLAEWRARWLGSVRAAVLGAEPADLHTER